MHIEACLLRVALPIVCVNRATIETKSLSFVRISLSLYLFYRRFMHEKPELKWFCAAVFRLSRGHKLVTMGRQFAPTPDRDIRCDVMRYVAAAALSVE